MARPKPTILFTDQEGDMNYDVCKADFVYAVYYEDQPINARKRPAFTSYPGPKYIKSSFAHAGHAFNLARKLNERFDTDKFYVVKMGAIRIIEDKRQDTE